jgi:hypothetical protein
VQLSLHRLRTIGIPFRSDDGERVLHHEAAGTGGRAAMARIRSMVWVAVI